MNAKKKKKKKNTLILTNLRAHFIYEIIEYAFNKVSVPSVRACPPSVASYF